MTIVQSLSSPGTQHDNDMQNQTCTMCSPALHTWKAKSDLSTDVHSVRVDRK